MSGRIITSTEAAARCGVSARTLSRMVIQDRFPQPVRLSARRIGWSEGTVNQWLAERETCAAHK